MEGARNAGRRPSADSSGTLRGSLQPGNGNQGRRTVHRVCGCAKRQNPSCLNAACPFTGMVLQAISTQISTEGLPSCLNVFRGLNFCAGIRAVLHCTPDDVPIHLFGFNWHNSTWRGHKVCCSTSCPAACKQSLSPGTLYSHAVMYCRLLPRALVEALFAHGPTYSSLATSGIHFSA